MPEKEDYYQKPLFQFEKLDVYQKALDFSIRVCDLTENLKSNTGKLISDQLIRASFSISLNISEGLGSYYENHKKRYFRIARASTFECVSALRICNRMQLFQQNDFNELYQECYRLSKMISGLINSIENRTIKK